MSDNERPKLADLIVHDDDDIDPETCEHDKYSTVTKYDGGRLPVLCSNCYTILGHKE